MFYAASAASLENVSVSGLYIHSQVEDNNVNLCLTIQGGDKDKCSIKAL